MTHVVGVLGIRFDGLSVDVRRVRSRRSLRRNEDVGACERGGREGEKKHTILTILFEVIPMRKVRIDIEGNGQTDEWC